MQTTILKEHSDTSGIKGTRYLFEVLAWIIFGIIATIFENLQTFFIFGAIIYLFVEYRKRNRSKTDIGIKKESFRTDLKLNWGIIVLVGIITQLLSVLLMYWLQPGTLTHIIARIPLLGNGSIDIMTLIVLYLLLIFSTLGEELVFRVLLQNRLSWYISPWVANLCISIIFGIAHFQTGELAVILFDIIPIIIDSMIFGWLWQRTHNVLIPWIAHWLADWVGLTLLLFFI